MCYDSRLLWFFIHNKQKARTNEKKNNKLVNYNKFITGELEDEDSIVDGLPCPESGLAVFPKSSPAAGDENDSSEENKSSNKS